MYVGQDRPETQCATNEAARFMSGPTRGAKCMLKLLCNCSEAPALSRAVTDANWAGELEGLCSTSCGWTYFGDHLLETCRQQSRLWNCQPESEYLSITMGTAHALVVSSAMVEFGLTFNVVCETDASAGRAMATRRGEGRVRHLDARLSSCAQKAWFKFEPGLEHNEADLGTKIVFI